LDVELLVEAVLFSVNREVKASFLMKKFNLTSQQLKDVIERLKQRYAGAVEVKELDDSFVMRVKPSIAQYVKDVFVGDEFSKKEKQVLAVLKEQGEVTSAQLSRTLGSGVYEAVRRLVERGFVKKKRAGRSFTLSLTPKFFKYFEE
jgi:segregation and condensation protein B